MFKKLTQKLNNKNTIPNILIITYIVIPVILIYLGAK